MKVARVAGHGPALAGGLRRLGGRTSTAPVNTFFDDILVMAEDPEVRAARLGLLATIRDLAAPVLDWQAMGS